jgi:hypothetical protein
VLVTLHQALFFLIIEVINEADESVLRYGMGLPIAILKIGKVVQFKLFWMKAVLEYFWTVRFK